MKPYFILTLAQLKILHLVGHLSLLLILNLNHSHDSETFVGEWWSHLIPHIQRDRDAHRFI